jgi:hypothetical protein
MKDVFASLCGTGLAITDTNPGMVSTDWVDLDPTALGNNRVLGGGKLVVARFVATVAFTANSDPDNTVELQIVLTPKTLATPTTARTLAAFDNTTAVAGAVITSTAHGLTNGTRVTVAQTSGTLNTTSSGGGGPAYAVATWLYVVAATTDTFGLSGIPGGAPFVFVDQAGTTTVTWYPEVIVSSGAIPWPKLVQGTVVELSLPPGIRPPTVNTVHRYLYAMFVGPTDMVAGTMTCDLQDGFSMAGQPFNKVNYVTAN